MIGNITRSAKTSVLETTHRDGADDRLEEAFSRLGVPLTEQRRLVWNHFATCGRATTIAEAAAELGASGVGQATVYRTVALLSDMGLLVQVQTSLAFACYAAIGVGHTHPLVCRECREVVEFCGDGDLTHLEAYLRSTTGFAIYGHHLEVYGVCPKCSAKAKATAGHRASAEPGRGPK